MKFKNPKGMKKWWGDEEPKSLVEAFSCLHDCGFTGPVAWDDPTSLCLLRAIDDDLFVKVLFLSFGEDVGGAFTFDTGIHICSFALFEIEAQLNLWEGKNGVTEFEIAKPHVTLWSIRLSHLKWNSTPGRNPCWVSNPEGPKQDWMGANWVDDWRCYGEPYLAEIRNPVDAAQRLLAIPNYVKSPWVKSDGPLASAAYETAIMLLVSAGRRDEATYVLGQVELAIEDLRKHEPLTHAKQFFARRIARLKEWVAGSKTNA